MHAEVFRKRVFAIYFEKSILKDGLVGSGWRDGQQNMQVIKLKIAGI